MFPCFLKPGKHSFIIQAETKIYQFKEVSLPRSEDIPPFQKQLNALYKVRQFKKETSVFAPWKPATKPQLEKALTNDWTNLTIDKLIKDSDQQEALRKAIAKDYPFIIDLFTQIPCKASYPVVGWIDY